MWLNNVTARGKMILLLIVVAVLVAMPGYFVWQKQLDTNKNWNKQRS